MKSSFDVLVVGAGPAGMAAAVCAAECGRSVGVVDDNPAPGGQIWRRGAPKTAEAQKWISRFEASKAIRLQRWRVFAAPDPGLLLAERSQFGAASNGSSAEVTEIAELRYDKLILATGARELFLPFPGWTLPNVMGAGGLDALARGGLPLSGKRVLVAGSGPLLLAVAAELVERGAVVCGVCEQASTRQLLPFGLHLLRQPDKLMQGAQLRIATRGVPFLTNSWPVAARGEGRLESVTVRRGDKQWEVPCDYLACGFHLVPNIELPMMLGCSIEGGFVAVDATQQSSVTNTYCAGEPTGIGGVESALLEGEVAGLAAAGRSDQARSLSRRRPAIQKFVRALESAFALNPELRKLPQDDTLVCRCEDVPMGALREHRSWRAAKLLTRCGMGPCQGRICGAATGFLFGWTADSVRPPLFPSRISSLSVADEPAVAANQLNTNRKDKL